MAENDSVCGGSKSVDIFDPIIEASSQAVVLRLTGRRYEMGTILLIILVLMLIGAFPTWPHSREWGYGPSGGLGLLVVILIVLLLLGKI